MGHLATLAAVGWFPNAHGPRLPGEEDDLASPTKRPPPPRRTAAEKLRVPSTRSLNQGLGGRQKQPRASGRVHWVGGPKSE